MRMLEEIFNVLSYGIRYKIGQLQVNLVNLP